MENFRIADENHIWYNGKQYISLNRVSAIENKKIEETKLLNEEVERLTRENEAYKVLLKVDLEKE